MAAFDAELYLRLLGEDALLDPEPPQGRHGSPLELPAAALVAAGAIDARRAERVIDDYDRALERRAGLRHYPLARSSMRSRGRSRLRPRRTFVLDHELQFGGGRLRLRDVTIGRRDGALRYSWNRTAPGRTRGRRRQRVFGGMPAFPWGTAVPSITDDRGRRPTVTEGSGGGNDDHWEGRLELSGTLSADSEWLEVEGQRITLDPRTAPCEITVEPLPAEDPVARLLWRRLAVNEMPFHRATDIEPALAALLAAGALQPDDPLVRDVRAVAAKMPDHPHHPGMGRARATSGRGAGPLPEPWRSLLRRAGRSDGPTRTLVVGALTPPFDGIQVAVHSLSSDPDGFEVEFEISPNVLQAGAALGELPFAWWARDDAGRHHLGAPGSWGGSDDHADGTLRFWPALHPRARRLELLPSAETERAVIAISLDDRREDAP